MRATVPELPIVVESLDIVSARGAPILHDVSMTITAGRPTAFVGPNGSGKTTLLRILMGLSSPEDGRRIASGRILRGGREDSPPDLRAIVFQRPVMLRRSVAANLAFALAAAGLPADDHAVRTLLDRVGLSHLAERPARQLSSGEQQRLAIARALAREPALLLLDEPTASLDPAATANVEAIVTDVAEQGVKVVIATHDLGQARRLAGDVVLLVGGRLVEHAPVERFFTNPSDPRTAAFLRGDLVV